MSLFEGHLSDEDLLRLAEGQEEDLAVGLQSDLGDVRLHLASCGMCQRLLRSYEEIGKQLRGLPIENSELPGRTCPPRTKIMEFAAGLTSPEDIDELLEHCTSCDRCGPALRVAIDDFANELTFEEVSSTKRLKSSGIEWQEALAARLSRSQRNRAKGTNYAVAWWKTLIRWPGFMVPLASMLLVGFAAFWLLRPPPDRIAEQLLSEAYSQQRTMELRIPEANYSPLRVERKGESNGMDRPSALLEAEALIVRKTTEHPDDPKWLELRARADLLEGNYDSSIRILRRAAEIEPNSAGLLADLASAYFERGDAQDRPADYGSAIDNFGKALAIKPEDPVVLFNRAIASERIFLYTQAIEDWQHYLRIEPSGKWADEARDRLERLQNKLKKHELGSLAPLLNPIGIAEHRNDPSIRAAVNTRFEEYLRVATRDWLPEAFPRERREVTEDYVKSIRKSLQFLAEISKTDHGDGWLGDLLLHSQTNRFPDAISSLSGSLRSIDQGDFAVAERDAREAWRLFQADSNKPGTLRAGTERIYALHLSQEGVACSKLAASVEAELLHEEYAWLRGQVSIEHAICRSITGELDKARESYEKALETAEKSSYGALYLRALLGISDLDSVTGNTASAWHLDLKGLSLFWDGNYPAMRGYSIYTDFDTLAASAHLWNLQVAAVQQAINTLGPDKNELLRAMIHSRLASAAMLAGKGELARKESEEAKRLFRSAPQTEAIRNNQIETEIWSARLDLDRGQSASAIQRLTAWQREIPRISNNYTAINFYQTLGSAQARLGERTKAEESLQTAITLSEQSLRSLHSERDRQLWSHETGDSYRSLAESRFHENDLIGALEVWEWYRGAALGRNVPQKSRGDSEVRSPGFPNRVASETENLKHETVLTYLVQSDGLIVWANDNRGITAKRVAIQRAQLEELTRRYSAMCADPHSSIIALDRDAQALYRLLVEPISKYLDPGRTLIIEPDEPLYSIPFQSLRDPRGNYLVEEFPLVWSLGLYFTHSSEVDTPLDASTRLFAVSVPAISTGNVRPLVALPDAAAEVDVIAAKFNNVHLAKGTQASVSVIKEELPKAGIFHFAGHAISNADRVGLIVVGDGAEGSVQGFLDARQLVQISLVNTKLAVFSACSTERTEDGSFDDPQSLVRSFLRAGVHTVVASRWDVDSAATAILMNEFYDRLLGNTRSAQALRMAALKVRSNKKYDHPYYWAAFSLFGKS